MHVNSDPLHSKPFRARLFRNADGRFSQITNANVLIYWPHGFGDWVFLSYVLPLLEPTNRYWITRFGDDTVSVMEGNEWAFPLYTGIQSPHCDDGAVYGNRHFGIAFDEADGSERQLFLPAALHQACQRDKIDTVLVTSFPETFGWVEYPFHSKARNIARELVKPERLRSIFLEQPLRNTIDFSVPEPITRLVEARLRSWMGIGDYKLCLIGRTGYSATGKNWGHEWREDLSPERRQEAYECREFMRLLLRKDSRWCFLSMEDRLFTGDDTVRSKELRAFSYAELFGEVGIGSLPFGLLLKALVNRADLSLGVPAGPFHLSMAKRDLPVVGLWLCHFPSWYDEPKADSIHLIGRHVIAEGLAGRPGSFFEKERLTFRNVVCDTRHIGGQQVLDAVEQMMG